MFPPIETPRCILRPIRADDAAPTARLISPMVSRWVASWQYPFTEAMAQSRIEITLEKLEAGDALPIAVVEKASAELMGWIMFHRHADTPQKASFGYWLGEAFHGKGYMREAAPAAVNAAFEILQVNEVEAAAQTENAASFAVMRACGMQFIREEMVFAPSRGREEACHLYAIKRPLKG